LTNLQIEFAFTFTAVALSENWSQIPGRLRYDLYASFMTLTAIVIGTGLRNADASSRSRVIRRRCVLGEKLCCAEVPRRAKRLTQWRCI